MWSSPLSFVLAEVTVQAIGGWLAALLASMGVVSVLFLLMMHGFWDKTGKPAVRALLTAMHAEPDNVKKRQEEIQTVIQNWHNTPDQTKTRTEFVKGVIDNEVRRDDGVIHKDVKAKVSELEQDLAQQLNAISAKFDKFQEAQERRDKENRDTNTQVLARLGRIEGAVQTMSVRKLPTSGSYPNLPAQGGPRTPPEE